MQGGAREAPPFRYPKVSSFPKLVTVGLSFPSPAPQKLLLQLCRWRRRLAGQEPGAQGRSWLGTARGQHHNFGSVRGSWCSVKNLPEPQHPCECILNASGLHYF